MLLLWIIFVICVCLFLLASWSPAGKGLASWLSCVWCFLVFLSLSHMVPWVRFGTWFYRFLIFTFLLTLGDFIIRRMFLSILVLRAVKISCSVELSMKTVYNLWGQFKRFWYLSHIFNLILLTCMQSYLVGLEAEPLSMSRLVGMVWALATGRCHNYQDLIYWQKGCNKLYIGVIIFYFIWITITYIQ